MTTARSRFDVICDKKFKRKKIPPNHVNYRFGEFVSKRGRRQGEHYEHPSSPLNASGLEVQFHGQLNQPRGGVAPEE
jgi:hypothetical protein